MIRIIVKVIVKVFFTLLVLALLAASWIIYTESGKKWLKESIQEQIEKKTALNLQIANITWDFPFTINIDRLQLHSREGALISSVERGTLSIAMRPLLNGLLQVKAIELEDVVVENIPFSIPVIDEEQTNYWAFFDHLWDISLEKLSIKKLKLSTEAARHLSLPSPFSETLLDLSLTGWIDKNKQLVTAQLMLNDHLSPLNITRLVLSTAHHADGKIALEGALEEPSEGFLAQKFSFSTFNLPSRSIFKLFFKSLIEPPSPKAQKSVALHGSFETALFPLEKKNFSKNYGHQFPQMKGFFSLDSEKIFHLSSFQAALGANSFNGEAFINLKTDLGEIFFDLKANNLEELPLHLSEKLEGDLAIAGHLYGALDSFNFTWDLSSSKIKWREHLFEKIFWRGSSSALPPLATTSLPLFTFSFLERPGGANFSFRSDLELYSSLSLSYCNKPFSINGDFFWKQAVERLEITRLSAASGPLAAKGGGYWLPAEQEATIAIEGSFDDLTSFDLPAEIAAGTGTFTLNAQSSSELFQAELSLLGKNLGGETISADSARIAGQVEKRKNSPLSASTEITVEKAALLDQSFEDIHFSALFNEQNEENNFQLQITRPFPTVLTGFWELKENNRLVLRADNFIWNNPSFPIALQDVASFILSHDSLIVSPATWNLAKEKAPLTLSGKLSKKSLEANVTLNALSLSSLNSLISHHFPLGQLEGVLNGTFSISGPWQDPDADLDIKLEKVAFGNDLVLPLGRLKSEIHASIHSKILESRAAIRGLLVEKPLTFNVTLPLDFKEQLGAVSLNKTAPFKAEINGSGDLTPFLELLAPDRVDLGAQGAIYFKAEGSLEKPEVDGNVRIHHGHLEDFDSGAILQNIFGTIRFEGDRIAITDIQATDGLNGLVRGAGSYSLDPEEKEPLKLTFDIKNLKMVRLDNAQAQATGEITLLGEKNNLQISGQLTADPVEITIPDQLPPDVVTIDVNWIGSHSPPIAQPKKARATFIHYNVKIDIPAEAKIVDKNLSSAWKGTLEVKGDSENLELFGECKLLSGTYDFRGKPLPLSQGIISFSGDIAEKSTIHLIATEQLENVKIEIVLHGPLKDPLISFRSNPPLSRRDILSRLLFGKASSDISPLEDTQLTQSLSSLSSQQSDDGLLDKLRSTLPFDRIDIGSKNENSNTLSLGIGKYYKGVLFSIKRDIASDSSGTQGAPEVDGNGSDRSRFSVETQLLKNIKLQAEIDDSSRTEFIIKWQHDY